MMASTNFSSELRQFCHASRKHKRQRQNRQEQQQGDSNYLVTVQAAQICIHQKSGACSCNNLRDKSEQDSRITIMVHAPTLKTMARARACVSIIQGALLYMQKASDHHIIGKIGGKIVKPHCRANQLCWLHGGGSVSLASSSSKLRAGSRGE
jgi:hypothetical protein